MNLGLLTLSWLQISSPLIQRLPALMNKRDRLDWKGMLVTHSMKLCVTTCEVSVMRHDNLEEGYIDLAQAVELQHFSQFLDEQLEFEFQVAFPVPYPIVCLFHTAKDPSSLVGNDQ